MKEILAVIIILTVILLGYSLFTIKLAQNLHGKNMWAAYSLAATLFIAWAVLYVCFIIETGKLMNTKRFSTNFSPWLETKLAEENDEKTNLDISLSTSEIQDLSDTVMPVFITKSS